ncbi:nucleoside deaminase [Pelagibacterales bacterium]|jgi:tRNA(adenine34) deaminase|nr:nucleoside deaminase [Pelagibacterales bacterium]MDA9136933.1 nucleoside deaminase [Pelagibacterales bacterium]MDA9372941.1 nucleoside deaminase [Pelagibacterales bacterium]MDB9985629.1 nucleoside deaminase [Pelagibacterales bacterium]|tara:strand:- start:542 stop:997 length:456 start_codon:yes stop_codon:yes gene_type:complete
MTNSQNIMFEAIKCAEEANSINEVPVGAIIYNSQTSQIISKSFNKTNKNLDPTAHAEINVIRDACKILNTSRLINCDLYVTLEPCMMCAAAISQARIRRLYFGADDLKYGSINGNINYFQKENTNHLPEIYDNICSESCNRLLINFFKERR